MSNPQQGGVHRRVAASKQKDIPHSEEPEVQEESVLRGLLPCVLTIGGFSLFLWLLGYFLIPARTNLMIGSSVPNANKAAMKCTPINNVKELILELNDIQDWMLLGQQLKVEQGDLDQWKHDIAEPELRLRAVLRDWYNSTTEHCWEAIWSALKSIGQRELADSIAVKYRTRNQEQPPPS